MRFVIGDIHGMSGMLESLLGQLPMGEVSELVFLGDYIGKGPGSKDVLETLIKLPKEVKSIFLMGNHEYALLDYLNGNFQRKEFLIKYGCGEFLTKDIGGLKDKHLDFVRRLKHFYVPEDLDFVCVHAGILKDFDLESGRYDPEKLVFTRGEFIDSSFLYKGKRVIFGHTAFKIPYVDGYKIGVDTGAVYRLMEKDGRLTAFEMENEFFVDNSGQHMTLTEVRSLGTKRERVI